MTSPQPGPAHDPETPPPAPRGGLFALRRQWLDYLSNPQVLVLTLLLLGGFLLVVFLGGILAPVIAALVIAYVLQSPVSALAARGVPHLLAVVVVTLGFVALIFYGFLALGPLLYRQLSQLVLQLPSMVGRVQEIVLELPDRYPELIGREQVVELTNLLQEQLLGLGQGLVTYSVTHIGNLFTLGMYLFLVPLLVFFFLKDRDAMVSWFLKALPPERGLAARVWREVDQKIGAYVRGKIFEVGIIGVTTWIAFIVLGVPFAALLASLTGLSVLVPYIGVVAAAVPVGFVALVQFGPGTEFALAIGAYGVIQVIDGNILAPLLISEAVSIHPVVVVTAILIFGGIWGFWGVFFAIPLATLALAVGRAWPRAEPAG